MNLKQECLLVLDNLTGGLGEVSSTAYDTAWVARLGELDPLMSRWAINWLRHNQLPDGSWGNQQPLYHHDRLICTLAAVIALVTHGDPKDNMRIQRAIPSISRFLNGLGLDLSGETIGFEMIVPTLFEELEKLGVMKVEDNPNLLKLYKMRQKKLSMLPNGMVNRFVPLSFSTEMAGADNLHLLDIPNLQEDSGAIGQNPSATAYFATHVRYGDPAALSYLREIGGFDGTPHLAPLEIFEQGWILWNFQIAGLIDQEINEIIQPFLTNLEESWDPKNGVGHTVAFSNKDGDDSALVYEVLRRFGRDVPISGLLYWEEKDYFRCFPIESNASTSTNVHVLGALRHAGYAPTHPSVEKVVRFLVNNLTEAGFWVDKWHISPYYVTGHLIITAAGYVEPLVKNAISWILETRNADGSWGYYFPTAEETAYCLQALAVWRQNGYPVPGYIFQQGAEWLSKKCDPPYPPLWIGKCLYTPPLVIRSAILSAISLARSESTEPVAKSSGQGDPELELGRLAKNDISGEIAEQQSVRRQSSWAFPTIWPGAIVI